MDIKIENVELRNRVQMTKERAYTKRDGSVGKIEPRPYFTVDFKNDEGAMTTALIYIDAEKKAILEEKIKNLVDHAKLSLICKLESTFDGQFRVVLKDINPLK